MICEQSVNLNFSEVHLAGRTNKLVKVVLINFGRRIEHAHLGLHVMISSLGVAIFLFTQIDWHVFAG